MKKNYNIGLDIGTNSVGWAIVEEDTQKIIKKGGKALWGVRLFDDANTAESRRVARGTRRRYERRRQRIKLLQEIFKGSIDDKFFQLLQESKYHENDKTNKTIKLTDEEKGKIKEYHRHYPTIYHLRNELVKGKDQCDIRLVYLAIHHIIKYRGNFIYANKNFNVKNLDIKEKMCNVFDTILNLLPSLNLPDNYISLINFNSIEQILLCDSKSDIKLKLYEELSNVLSKDFINEFGKMIVGNKFNLTKMLILEDDTEKIELSFKDTDYDEKYEQLASKLGNNIEILASLKELYDTLFLKKLFKGRNNASLSELMITKYQEHKDDLSLLKGLFDKNRPLYNQLFRTTPKYTCYYDKYVSNNITTEEFIKILNKLLEELFSSNTKIDQEISNRYIQNKYRIVNGDFLPRITSTDNGKYPYQLNKDELINIIENQGKFYPFLLNKTEDGMYKIVRLLEFRIPYYVGPLVSSEKSQFAWMERKIDHEKITPYNFDRIIDKEKTAEKFIKRMISHCTYLFDEYALPNNSILYSKFKVMNELKQIRINGEKLSVEQQQNAIKDLFEKMSGSITNKKFIEYIKSTGEWDMYDNYNITGYSSDGKFANNMQSYIDFFGEDGIFENTDYDLEDAEQIIEWITIFQDKDILKDKIINTYSKLKEKIEIIIKKSYSGWGTLSKKLLETKYCKDKTNETYKSILDIMEETSENFMQVLNNDKYKFQDMIKEYNSEKIKNKLSYDVVENLATSPSTKRGIYQALKITDELVKYMGYEPKNIIVEMSRGDEEKKRTDDRKKYLISLYLSCKNDIENYNVLFNQLNKVEKISSQKLFLYFIQEGKCLYCGKPLNIEDLELYEIDHIIPRTLIKDDSIDNKALVYRECNQNKAASYVLPKEYRNEKNKIWWKKLKDKKLISAKKFHNLIRSEYSDEDIEGFINRQLVETRQIIKHVANILSNYYEKTKVIYLKAELSHNYRERYDLFKFREINDYHHAHDAYLAAVLGEYKEKYMKKKLNFEMVKELNSKLRELGQNKKLKYGYVINSLDDVASGIVNKISKNLINEETGEVVFDAKKFNQTVEDTLYRNDILISKKTEIRTGEFYNQTKQKKGGNGVPLKENMPINYYGSYTSINPSYAVMIKYTSKNKECKKLVGFPILLRKASLKDIENYFRNLLKLKENDSLTITNKKVPFYSLINWNNKICYLVGASDKVEVCNAKQFKYNKAFMKKNKYALNKLFNKRDSDKIVNYEENLNNIITYIVNSMNSDYELFSNLIPELKEMINYDKHYNDLAIEEKEKIIKELTKLLNCKSDNANFKFLNGKYSSAFGKKHSRIIDVMKLINKSTTGLREDINEF